MNNINWNTEAIELILHPFSDLDSGGAASHSQLSKTSSIELQKTLGFSILQNWRFYTNYTWY